MVAMAMTCIGDDCAMATVMAGDGGDGGDGGGGGDYGGGPVQKFVLELFRRKNSRVRL